MIRSTMLASPALSTDSIRAFQLSCVPILCAVSQRISLHQFRALVIHRLRDHSAHRKTAEERILHRKQIEQAEEVGCVIIDRVGHLADGRQSVATLVVEHDRIVTSQSDDNIAPDPEVGSERVDENDNWLVGRPAYQLVMDRCIVDACELHCVFLHC
jgi:hypothetical protein